MTPETDTTRLERLYKKIPNPIKTVQSAVCKDGLKAVWLGQINSGRGRHQLAMASAYNFIESLRRWSPKTQGTHSGALQRMPPDNIGCGGISASLWAQNLPKRRRSGICCAQGKQWRSSRRDRVVGNGTPSPKIQRRIQAPNRGTGEQDSPGRGDTRVSSWCVDRGRTGGCNDHPGCFSRAAAGAGVRPWLREYARVRAEHDYMLRIPQMAEVLATQLDQYGFEPACYGW